MFWINLGFLVIQHNVPAAYAIRGIFSDIITLLNGFLRTRNRRWFIVRLLIIINQIISLPYTTKVVTFAATMHS